MRAGWYTSGDIEAFPAYLRRTIVNLAMSHFRRRSVERTYLTAYGAPRTVEDSVEASVAEHDRVRDALLRLPERQRAAIVLRFYQDLSDARIAELLRCRQGTVRSLVSRGAASLREAVTLENEDT